MASNGLSVNINFDQFKEQLQKIPKLEQVFRDSLDLVAVQAYAEAIRLVQAKLRSNRNIYLENLALEKSKNKNDPTYIIVLREKALWVEEGVPAHNLKKTHLKNRESVIIPFQHNKNIPSLMSNKQQLIYKEIKSALRKEQINLSRPITNSKGVPVISTLKKITPAAILTNVPSQFKSKATGQSILNNLNIYQHEIKTPKGVKIQKTLMTFRTLNKNSTGWNVPELKGVKILDEVYTWILENYTRIIAEKLMNINLV